MINPDFELDKLRWSLQNKDYLPQEIDDICDLAAYDVNEIILDAVAGAVAQAVTFAENLKIEDFIREMMVADTGISYYITSRSGRTDYSIPEQEMLPHLLKNAKISSDGTRYKVIPVQDKAPSNIGTSSDAAMYNRQILVENARNSAKNLRNDGKSVRANSMAENLRSALAQNMNQQRASNKEARVVGPVKFRTATSKQDPHTQWVLPAKEKDMTQFLGELNYNLQNTIDTSVIAIIDSYKREYE